MLQDSQRGGRLGRGKREADKRLAPKVLARDIFFLFMFIVIQDALMHVLTSVRTYG